MFTDQKGRQCKLFTTTILILFIGSGCSALIYEVVWFEMLRFVIGSSAISLAVLLGSFMGGMCIGSLAFPRLVTARHHPLRVYAALEACIGMIGIALLWILPFVGTLYASSVGYGTAGILLRGAVCIVGLLPPTILMGATLPAISRWAETTARGVSKLGLFYAGNIVGAVLGCLLAGFYLLRVHDVAIATMFAAMVNSVVAAVGLFLAQRHTYQEVLSEQLETKSRVSPLVYVVIALSGLTALGAEVVWTRVLSLLMGATVYTFSIILAVFLAGLGIGSGVGSALARHLERPYIGLGVCQLLLLPAIGWAAFMIAEEIPFWLVNPQYLSDPTRKFLHDIIRCTAALLPATSLWGASFPLALASAASRGQDLGRLVGGVYAANTIGAIAGAMVFSLAAIPLLGTGPSQRWLIWMSASAGLLMLLPTHPAVVDKNRRSRKIIRPLTVVVVSVIVIGFAHTMANLVPPTPASLITHGRAIESWGFESEILHLREGISASVAVSATPDGYRAFHVSGKVVASSDNIDMRLQRMAGHLPALLHSRPRSVLVVGCGAGVTAGSFVVHPDVERIVVCEIEPAVVEAARQYFGQENHDVLSDPRTSVIIDDARHFLATTNETFDVITSDPIHPWVRGAAALYSAEYYELTQRHLNSGGVVAQWVPLYETSEASVKSQVGTFMRAFPSGTLWSSDPEDRGYDLVMIGQQQVTPIDLREIQKRWDENPDLQTSLEQIQLNSAVQLMETFAGQKRDLKMWLEDAQINTDHRLRLQYLAGLAIDEDQSNVIYNWMRFYRRYPENLFIVDADTETSLRRKFSGIIHP